MAAATSVLLLISYCFATAAALRIGVVCDTSTHVGRQQKIAFEIAAEDFNTTADPVYLNITSSDDLRQQHASKVTENLIMSWGAEVIISSTNSLSDVASIANMGFRSRVPALSLMPNIPIPTFSSNPFLINMYPSSPQVKCIASLVKSFNWTRVVAIFEDDDLEGIIDVEVDLLSDALRSMGAEIDYRVTFPRMNTLIGPELLVRQRLEAVKQRLCSVFVVVRSSQTLASHLFKIAKEIGLMQQGYIWFINNDLIDLVDNPSTIITPSFISSYMQGVVGIKPYFNQTTASYQKFQTKFDKRFDAENVLNIFALRSYDAVELIVRAEVQRKKGNNTTTLMDGLVSESSFQGLSGWIKLGKDDRELLPTTAGNGSSPAFWVINVIGKKYIELGLWSYGSSAFYQNEVDMSTSAGMVEDLGPVFWPGRPSRSRQPGGFRKLKIVVPNRPTFTRLVDKVFDNNGNVIGYEGFFMDVFQECAKILGFHLDYEFSNFTGAYDEVIEQVALQAFDMAVGDFSIISARAEKVEFTHPIISNRITKIVRTKRHVLGPWLFVEPFQSQVWILVALTLMTSGFLIWYFERQTSEMFGRGKFLNQLGSVLFFVTSIFFQRHGKLQNGYARLILVANQFFVMFLLAIYTANLTGIIVVPRLRPLDVEGKAGCNKVPFIVDYLKTDLKYQDTQIIRLSREEDYLKAFSNHSITHAFLGLPYAKILLMEHDEFTAVGPTKRFGGFGFAFEKNKNSGLANEFSKAILKLHENGAIVKLEQKWFSAAFFTSLSTTHDKEQKNSNRVGVDNLLYLFVFVVAVSFAVLIFYIVRQIWSKLLGVDIDSTYGCKNSTTLYQSTTNSIDIAR